MKAFSSKLLYSIDKHCFILYLVFFRELSIFNFQLSVFNLKKGVTLIRATPQLCIMNYELNQALRFYSITGRIV